MSGKFEQEWEYTIHSKHGIVPKVYKAYGHRDTSGSLVLLDQDGEEFAGFSWNNIFGWNRKKVT